MEEVEEEEEEGFSFTDDDEEEDQDEDEYDDVTVPNEVAEHVEVETSTDEVANDIHDEYTDVTAKDGVKEDMEAIDEYIEVASAAADVASAAAAADKESKDESEDESEDEIIINSNAAIVVAEKNSADMRLTDQVTELLNKNGQQAKHYTDDELIDGHVKVLNTCIRDGLKGLEDFKAGRKFLRAKKSRPSKRKNNALKEPPAALAGASSTALITVDEDPVEEPAKKRSAIIEWWMANGSFNMLAVAVDITRFIQNVSVWHSFHSRFFGKWPKNARRFRKILRRINKD